MVTRLASLTLAASLLSAAGCASWGSGSNSSSGGLFGRWHNNTTMAADCGCCDMCPTGCASCPGGGYGVVAHLPPSGDGPLLMPPTMAPGAVPNVTTAPPPRIAPIPQAAPMPYTP